MPEENTTYSIMLRIRRVIEEDAYISVPVSDKIMELAADGTYRVNFEAFVTEAMRLSEHPQVEWQVETVQKDVHPMQMPKPENRQVFDGFYHEHGG